MVRKDTAPCWVAPIGRRSARGFRTRNTWPNARTLRSRSHGPILLRLISSDDAKKRLSALAAPRARRPFPRPRRCAGYYLDGTFAQCRWRYPIPWSQTLVREGLRRGDATAAAATVSQQAAAADCVRVPCATSPYPEVSCGGATSFRISLIPERSCVHFAEQHVGRAIAQPNEDWLTALQTLVNEPTIARAVARNYSGHIETYNMIAALR